MKTLRWTALLLAAVILTGCKKKTETFTVPPMNEATPWTHLDANAAPENFQFAIVSDRTGGHRPGVFPLAMEKINLLQPEFVICVGDLIEGYTEDAAALKAEWDEFDGFVNRLDMPFFYVTGNHDISNAKMAEFYRQRYGTPYYHFIYRNCLFLIVCTEDPEDPAGPTGSQISSRQTAYMTKALADNSSVRWTFVFMHKPLFVPRQDKEGKETLHAEWAPIEQALQDRPHSVFAGHWHNYTKYKKHERSYIVLATTGGRSSLSGASLGSFDHFTWVTMKSDGPHLANLALDGIYDEDVATEESLAFANSLLSGSALSVRPIFVEGASFQKATTQLLLKNETKTSVQYSGSFTPHAMLTAKPNRITLTLAPGEQKTIDVQVTSATAVNVNDIAPLTLRYTAQQTHQGKSYAFESEMNLGVVRKYDCPRAGNITVDGKLDDWPALPIDVRKPAAVFKAVETYNGPDDCRFRLATSYDETNLYIAIEVFDDKLVQIEKSAVWNQDGVELRLLALPEPQRSMYRGRSEFRDVLPIAVAPADKNGKMPLWNEQALPKGAKVVSKPTKTGYTVEVAVPASYLDEKQGRPWREFRISLAVDDCDQPGKVAQLWWTPDLGEKQTYAGSGTFRKK
jgi:hypothetical protein